MMEVTKRVYICKKGHIQLNKDKCSVCGAKIISSHPQVVTKGDKV